MFMSFVEVENSLCFKLHVIYFVLITVLSILFIKFFYFLLQCFDAVGWASGRASGK